MTAMEQWFPVGTGAKQTLGAGRRRGAAPCASASECLALLDLDGRALFLELALGVVRDVLRDLLQDRRRCALDEVLGLLEAEARDRADRLDDVDLLVTDGGEDHVELGLLLGGLCASAGAAGRRHHDGRRSRGLNVERLLELLDEVGQLEKGHLLEALEQVLRLDLGHRYSSSFCAALSSVLSGAGASSVLASLASGLEPRPR